MTFSQVSSGVRVVMVLVLCQTLAGCGTAPSKRPANAPAAYPVRGIVTMDEKPLAEATVVLQSESGGPAASAITDADGKFALTTYDKFDGAPAGDYRVIVMQYERVQRPEGYNADTSAPLKPPALISPPRYSDFAQSGLTAHVEPGPENNLTLQLSSSK